MGNGLSFASRVVGRPSRSEVRGRLKDGWLRSDGGILGNQFKVVAEIQKSQPKIIEGSSIVLKGVDSRGEELLKRREEKTVD